MHKMVLSKLAMERRWRERRGATTGCCLSRASLISLLTRMQASHASKRARCSCSASFGASGHASTCKCRRSSFLGTLPLPLSVSLTLPLSCRNITQKRLSILDVTLVKHRTTKIETLRAECTAYGAELAHHEQDLRQVLANIETTRIAKAVAETKIAASAKNLVYVDARLLDGTAVRMEAHQLLLHQVNEIARLELARAKLEERLAELRCFDPGANQAARIIQSRCEGRRGR